MKRPLPKAMRDERERIQARRDHIAMVLRLTGHWGLPGTAEDKAELADLDRRLAGFDAFECGES
jgi:hypothetical protein